MNTKNIVIALVVLCNLTACKKFVEIDPPKTALLKEATFSSDKTALAVLASTYNRMTSGFLGGSTYSYAFLSSLSSDELDLHLNNQAFSEFANNVLLAENSVLSVTSGPWAGAYQNIYATNTLLEGVASSTKLSDAVKTQLEGEARFLRAYTYFYLVNFFGDVPLITTTNYHENAKMPRTEKAKIYQQIVLDLKESSELLTNDYNFIGDERVRPNKYAAKALLARVYLYLKDWPNAEKEASEVIASNLYSILPVNDVFLKNSKEAIWQLTRDNANTNDAITYFMSATAVTPNNAALKESFYNEFEANDLRRLNWIGSRTTTAGTFRFPYKYKVNTNSPVTEYSMKLRIAEQFLIRAEARAHLDKITGSGSGAEDLNVIRERAGLLPVTPVDTDELLGLIEKERKFELFTEEGHRWMDLKRTNRIDAVMAIKNPHWESYMQWYPIPQKEIINNPSMKDAQNEGY